MNIPSIVLRHSTDEPHSQTLSAVTVGPVIHSSVANVDSPEGKFTVCKSMNDSSGDEELVIAIQDFSDVPLVESSDNDAAMSEDAVVIARPPGGATVKRQCRLRKCKPDLATYTDEQNGTVRDIKLEEEDSRETVQPRKRARPCKG